MSESEVSPTVRDIFALPEVGGEGSEGWKVFQEKLRKEVKGIKTAAMPEVAAKVGQLFEIPIPEIFLTSWKKASVLQELLAESQESPETVMTLELAEHTINSQHRPHIEVKIQGKSVKKIEFILRLVFRLKGFDLKIQNGAIREMTTGACDARGTLEYKGLVIAEKKLAPIDLPASVPLEPAKALFSSSNNDNAPSTTDTKADVNDNKLESAPSAAKTSAAVGST